MAPLSNLPEPDPCDGPPIRPNRTLGFTGTISNLPKATLDCGSPATILLTDWTPISDPSGTPNIRAGTQAAIAEWTGSTWKYISTVDIPNLLGISGSQYVVVRSFVRWGNQIWICVGNGNLLRSLDSGKTFTVNISFPFSFTDSPVYIARDAAGRLWAAYDGFAGVSSDGLIIGAGIYRSDDGKGDSWQFIASLPSSGSPYFSDGTIYGAHHRISCHPTSKDTIILTYLRSSGVSLFAYAYVTTNGQDFSEILLPGQSVSPDNEAFYGIGDQDFGSDGRFYFVTQMEWESDSYIDQIYMFYSDDYETFSRVSINPEIATSSFGFMQQIYIDKSIVHVIYARDFYGDPLPLDELNTFDGFGTILARSNDKGESWNEIAVFKQPLGGFEDMPGYPQGIFYDPKGDNCWVFFDAFYDVGSQVSDINSIKDTFDQLVTADGSKSNERNLLSGIMGLADPVAKYGCVARPWPIK